MLIGAATLSAQDDWHWVSPAPTGLIPADIAFGDNTFLLAAGGQVLRSTDGVHWAATTFPEDKWPTQVVFAGDHFFAAGTNFTATVTSAGVIDHLRTVSVSLRGLCAGNGVLVALDNSTPVATALQVSHDETTWTRQALPEGFTATEIAFAHGAFVVVGRDGTVLRSTDGTTWQRVTVDPPSSTDTIAWLATNGSRFLVRWTHGHGFYHSDDGLTWTATTVSPPLGSWTTRATLGGADGTFYFDSGPVGKGVFLSPDGETWTALSQLDAGAFTYDVFPINFERLAGGHGFVVGLAPLFLRNIPNPSYYTVSGTLDAGRTWTSFTQGPFTPGPTGYPVRGLGRFYFQGKSSPDGLTWSDTGFAPTHAAGERLFRLSSIDSLGRDVGPVVNNANYTTQLRVSHDGLTSTIVDPAQPKPWAIAQGAGRYVLVGAGGRISTSTDGDTWVATPSGVELDLWAVTYAWDLFIAGGAGNTLLTSPDGLTWTSHPTPDLLGANITTLAASPDRLVVGSSFVTFGSASSTLNMTLLGHDVVFPRERIVQSVAWFRDRFVAATTTLPVAAGYYPYSTNQLVESVDGATWTQVTTASSSMDMAEARPRVAVGPDAAIYTTRSGSAQSSIPALDLLLRRQTVDDTPIAITHAPTAQSAPRGESVVFTVGADGSGPFTYQWLHDSQPIAGATESILRLTGLRDTDAGAYAVRITNPVGTATSTAATLSVTEPVSLTITQQPAGGPLLAWTQFDLNVTVTGSGPISYQWRRNGSPIAGATLPTYSIWSAPYSGSTYVGSYDVVISAPYSTVTSHAVDVVWGGPQITLTAGDRLTVPAGGAFTAGVTAVGDGPFTYQWSRTGGGLTVPTNQSSLTLNSVRSIDQGPYTVTVTDATGASTQLYFMVVVGPAGQSRVATSPPQVTALGRRVELSATYSTTGAGDTARFQWYRDGQPIADATATTLVLSDLQPSDLGHYTVAVMDGADTYFSAPIPVLLRDARLVNLSARGWSGLNDDTFSVGFVLAGAAADPQGPILVRGIGPTLADFQVRNVLANPRLELKAGDGTVLAANDDWNSVTTGPVGVSAGRPTFLRYGAFALADTSHDSALAIPRPAAAPYTAPITSGNDSTGVVLTEIYVDPAGPQRLTNLSVRARTSPGDGTLTAGFVIGGTEPLRLMIRGVGPTLADFGVSGVLINPRILLFDATGTEIGNNDTWGNGEFAAEIRRLETLTGAFALPADSNDAVMIVTLEPGLYSAQIQGIGDPTGVALIELYELP